MNSTQAVARNATRIFIGNLPRNTEEEELESLLSRYGTITDMVLSAKGFAIVSYRTVEDASFAIMDIDERWWHNRRLYAKWARRQDAPKSPSSSQTDKKKRVRKNKRSVSPARKAGALSGPPPQGSVAAPLLFNLAQQQNEKKPAAYLAQTQQKQKAQVSVQQVKASNKGKAVTPSQYQMVVIDNQSGQVAISKGLTSEQMALLHTAVLSA
eukprot:TRINITY_DN4379_c0_g1_i1.p1 TRINITY_DN4379_c0_g1~~TRINITY_DN4379_c0_g1_i1.p1  ORF type:complete len:221 (-),score=64.73 TRINITY_DN4379_c0_g1_i1:21-653(-)